MLNSNCNRLLAALMLWGSVADARADKITFAGDISLSGVVHSINGEGIVELKSEISSDPLLITPETLERITFDDPASLAAPVGGMIELINGDLLPAVIGAYDGKLLEAATPDAGRLQISREFLKSLQLGVRNQKAIYAGPKSLDEWVKDGEGAKGWRFNAGALAASGQAVATRKIDLPARFVFKFTLKWQSSPNWTVSFADPLVGGEEKVDRYVLQLGPQGIEIRRESSTGQKSQPVILPVRTADEFPSKQVDVEIRMDRKTSRMHLFVNGEPEASGIDPVASPPTGNGVSFLCRASSSNAHQVQAIELWDFDNSLERHRAEDRGDLKSDSIITREDSRCSGRFTSIRPGTEGAVFTLESDFQEKPLELLESDVSTVFFAQAETNAPKAAKGGQWILKLRGGASLQLTECTFPNDRVKATHPLLGVLDIDRAGVTLLERIRPLPVTPPQE